MKRSHIVLLLTVLFWLILAEAASAQNTLTYATIDYDEETNTLYGYAYTEPDYSAAVYYRTAYVGAALKDGGNTQLVSGSTQCYDCRAELNLEVSGNYNPPYTIQSGHYVFLSYYVYNYYDPYVSQYRNGYLDYYYYTFFEGSPGGPVFNFPIFFSFTGRSPSTVQSTVNRFLGTLLTTFFPLPKVKSFSQDIIDESSQGSEVVECGRFKVITKYETGCPYGPGQETTFDLTGHITVDATLQSEVIDKTADDGETCTYEATRLYRMKNRLSQSTGTGFTSYRATVTWDGKTASKAGPGISTRATIPGVGTCP